MYKRHLISAGLVITASSHRNDERCCGERNGIAGMCRCWLVVAAAAHEKRLKEDKVLKRSGDDVEVWFYFQRRRDGRKVEDDEDEVCLASIEE
jgi:hypothetical protein